MIGDDWVRAELQKKIDSLDWQQAAADVAPFLKVGEQPGLGLWKARFFSQKLAKLVWNLR